jgi:hypothetical protein
MQGMRKKKTMTHVDEKAKPCDWIGGVQVDQLDERQNLIVETRNSTYEITVLDAERGEILVRDGSTFPEWTTAHLSGASLAGALLKVRGIFVGLDMEFEHDGQYMATSPVQRIGIPASEHQD